MATPNPDSNRTDDSGPWQPRFGIGAILLVMVVFSTMASGGYYLVQWLSNPNPETQRQGQFVFILFTLASPVLLAVIVSIVYWVVGRSGTRKKTQKLHYSSKDLPD